MICDGKVHDGVVGKQPDVAFDLVWHVVYVHEKKAGPKYGSLRHPRQHWAGTRLFAVEDHIL